MNVIKALNEIKWREKGKTISVRINSLDTHYMYSDLVEIVEQAGERQRHLCQGQSLNVFFPAGASKAYVHKTHFAAWKHGCKGMYYLRTESTQRAENVSMKIARDKLEDYGNTEDDSCVACEG